MVSNRLWLVVLSVLALSLGACGGDDGGGESGAGGASGDGDGDSASNDVPPEGICARVAAIQCAAQEACCVAPDETVAECMEDALRNCDDLAASAADPRVGYDRAAMTAALDDYQMRSAQCDPSVAERVVTGFASAFKGTVAEGGDCLPEGGAETEDVNDLAAALGSCMNNDTTACLPSETTWTCTARGAAGSPCFSSINCQDGLWCDGTDAMSIIDKVCVASKAANESCNAPEECASFVCKSGSCAASDDVQEIFCY